MNTLQRELEHFKEEFGVPPQFLDDLIPQIQKELTQRLTRDQFRMLLLENDGPKIVEYCQRERILKKLTPEVVGKLNRMKEGSPRWTAIVLAVQGL